MISKSLSTSEKRARLHDVAGRLAEFCQALYPLMVVHTDDFGRHPGDPFTVKHQIDPTSRRSYDEFARALLHLHEVELIVWYDAKGKKYFQVVDFDPHQPGLHKRTASSCPPPPAGSGAVVFEAREEEIEAFLAHELTSGALTFNDWRPLNIERQKRIGNAYLDLVVLTTGALVLIEVKRHAVTAAAVVQVRKYAALLARAHTLVRPFVVGLGVDLSLQGGVDDVGLLAFNEQLSVRDVAIPKSWEVTLKHTRVTSQHIPSELKRTEQEEKGTERTAVLDPNPSDVWPRILECLDISERNRREWFEPCRLFDFKPPRIVVNAPSTHIASWIQQHFRTALTAAVDRAYPNHRVEFVVKPLSVRAS